MSYPQETIARQFYNNLNQAFGLSNSFLSKLFQPNNSDIVITIEGAGVHWSCKVEKKVRECTISCFYYDFPYRQGAEYYISFIKDNNTLATGRTVDNQMALNVTKDWIEGKALPELYKTYKFVDQLKRKLEYINSTILNSQSEFKNCKPTFTESWGDSIDYTLKNKDRSIQYYIDGYINPPKTGFGFKFLWDDCTVFYAYNTNLNSFTPLIYDWLIINLKPSEIKEKYSWIELYSIAEYYEKGEGITGEFIESWDRVEIFYKELEFHLRDEVLNFIKDIRAYGFDKSLRAGTSLYSLILSKSRRYGLRQDQNSIKFSFGDDGVYVNIDTQKQMLYKGIKLSDEILQLIKHLNAEEIS